MTAENPFNNQDFRDEMTKLLDSKLSPLVEKVGEHEAFIQQQKGRLGLLAGLWSLLVVGLEYLFHRH